MPQVPTRSGPQQQLAGGGLPQFSAPGMAAPDARLPQATINTSLLSTPQFAPAQLRPAYADPGNLRPIELARGNGDQLQAAGRALGGASDMLARYAQTVQIQTNAAVVDDALNEARNISSRLTFGQKDEKAGTVVGGYRNAKGYDAIKRASGKPLDQEVGEEFDRQVADMASDRLANDAQRRAFQLQANDIGAQLRQGATVHQAEQFNTYFSGVYTAQVENQTQAFAALNPGDLEGQKRAVAQIEEAVSTLAVHNGASAQELDVGMRAARSKAILGLVEATVAEKKYTTAQALLNEWGPKIDANTAAKIKAGLDGRVAVQVGEHIANDLWQDWAAPSYQAGDADRGFNVVLATEGRGRVRHVDEKGKLIVSPRGAYGVAQLMPDTAAEMARKLKRPELVELSKQPTQEGEAANRILGKAYFDSLVERFSGDMPKAIAAYNAGPGWLVGGKDSKGNKIEGALKQSAATGRDWREFLPKETQDYVAFAMRSYGSGEGVPKRPSRLDLMDRIRQRTDDPDVIRAAESRLNARFSAAEADEREGHEQAYAEGLRVVRETGGNLNALSPELKARIKPDQFTQLQSYAKNMQDGDYVSTDPAAYYTAMSAAMTPGTTVNQLEAFRPHLSPGDFKAIQGVYMDRAAPQPGKGPDSLDVSTLDSILETRLQYLGVNTKPGKKDTEDAARLGAIQQFVHQYVLDYQKNSGAKITDYQAMSDVVNLLFTRNQGFRNTVLGVTTSRGSQNVMTSRARDIPADTRNRITTQLEKALGRKPSEAEVLGGYFRSQFYSGG
jgi:soluble lytic murein transglycosylase